MVDALSEVHRLLVAGGVLIDIHPLPQPLLYEVYGRGALVFSLPQPGFSGDAYRHARDALDEAVSHELFALEATRRFDFIISAASVPELRAYLEEANAFEKEPEGLVTAEQKEDVDVRLGEAVRTAGAGARVATHEVATVSSLRAVS